MTSDRGRRLEGVVALASCVVASCALASCADSDAGKCVSAVRFDGRSFVDVDDLPGYLGPTTIAEDQLGGRALVVTNAGCGEPLADGGATMLPSGTELMFVEEQPDLLGHVTRGNVALLAPGAEDATAVVVHSP